MQLTALQQSPSAFRDALLVDCDGRPMRLGDRLDDWQRSDFEALDPGWRAVVGQSVPDSKLRAWLERPRGHSKSSDLAVMASWVLFASRRRLAGYAAAADKDQARLLRDAIDRLVRLNDWLGRLLTVDSHRITNHHTGSTLEIISSDAATSYGLTPDFVIVDELTHWPRRELWDSLLSSAAKRQRCMLVAIANAGFQDSWQWPLREAVRVDDGWHFSRLDGPVASWLSERHLAEQRRLLPAIAFDRLWLNRWSPGSGDALDADAIARAVTLPGPLAGPERGWCYVAGLDLGLRRDASALAIVGVDIGWSEPVQRETVRSARHAAMVDLGLIEDAEDEEPAEFIHHPGTGRMRLADLRLWRPQGGTVDLDEIERTLLHLHGRYNLLSVAFDPWQAQHLAQRLTRAGVPMREVAFQASNLQGMARATMESFSESRLDLFPHEQLLADLRALRVIERAAGIRLESPRGPSGHGDSATALSLALLAASGMVTRPRLAETDSLICW